MKLENDNLKDNHEQLIEKFDEKEIQFKEITTDIKIKSEEKITSLTNKVSQMESELQDSKKKIQMLKERNKELGFQVQNFKYKVLDLEKKLMDAQFDLAIEKKEKNPLLR